MGIGEFKTPNRDIKIRRPKLLLRSPFFVESQLAKNAVDAGRITLQDFLQLGIVKIDVFGQYQNPETFVAAMAA